MDDIGSRADALEASARMAECLLLSGDDNGALDLADRCLARAQDLGGVASQTPLIHRVRGKALARLGQSDAAIDAWQQGLQAARSRGAEYEVALTERAAADASLSLQPPVADARSRS
jgi:predicted negative regulator of RcsB-dependent stress response